MSVDPETGEVRPVVTGSYVWSKSRRWNDSEVNQTPVGGHVIDGWMYDGAGIWLVAEVHRGRIEYHTLLEEDVDWEQYRPEVNKSYIRDLARVMNREMGRGGRDHMTALLALSNAVRGL